MAIENTHGMQFQASDMVASPTFATVAQLISIVPPGESRGSEDVATHDMSAGDAMTKLVDALWSLQPFEIRVVEDFADSTHDDTTGMRSFLADTTPRNFKIICPDAGATEISFAGYITALDPQERPANRGTPVTRYEITPTERAAIA